MAGLYVVLGQSDHQRIQAAAGRLTFFPQESVEILAEQQLAIAWVSHDPSPLFGPAYHASTGVRVVTTGRIAWDEPDWRRAEGLQQYTGGLSNRLLLDQYLNGGIEAVERHNGSAILLIWDPRQRILHLLTDHFGYHPVFLYRPENDTECVIATFADAMADDAEVHTTPDHCSMAEFLKEWQATPPHTYYNEIKYAGAATHWCWNLATHTCHQRRYWQPFEVEPFPSLQVAVDTLAEALRQAIRVRTLPRLAPIVTYTSGGLDSRLLLFAAADPSAMCGVNLYDAPNRESAVAEQICMAAGVQYRGFARDNDYYPRWMKPGVRISGAMWSLEDNHFLGTRDLLRQLGARTVLSACTADLLFKGVTLDRQHGPIIGRQLPYYRFRAQRSESFLPYSGYQSPPAPVALKSQIDERMAAWFTGTSSHLTSDKDWLQVEDRRVRPTCYVSALSGQIMYRVFPYDAFFADQTIADCYSRTRAQWKLNARLWGLVVRKIGHDSIIDANFGWRPGASVWEKLLVYSRDWCRRRLGLIPQDTTQGLTTQGSWPNLSWYVRHSPTLKSLWDSASQTDRELLTYVWGCDPWQTPLEKWAESPYDFFRLATLLSHWNVRRQDGQKTSNSTLVSKDGVMQAA